MLFHKKAIITADLFCIGNYRYVRRIFLKAQNHPVGLLSVHAILQAYSLMTLVPA